MAPTTRPSHLTDRGAIKEVGTARKSSPTASSRAPPPQKDETATSDPVRIYLKELGKIPLLTAAQEVDLAMRINGGAEALELRTRIDSTGVIDVKRFRRVIAAAVVIRERQLDPSNDLGLEGIGRESVTRRSTSGSASETIAFLRRFESDGHAAKVHLIEANLRLVVSVAKRYVGRGMLFLDLVQEGNLGLMRATEKFDHSKGFKFSTYAMWWIRQGISRGLADQARTIRVPVHISELIDTCDRVQRQLVQELGREPRAVEVGSRVGISVGRLLELRTLRMSPISLESPIDHLDGASLQEFVEDQAAVEPVVAALASVLRDNLDVVLATLTARESRIIQLRFGLTDGRPRTLEDVGREFDLTRERIRQIEAKALSKLRHPSSRATLHDFVE